MIPQSQVRKPKNSSKINLLISLVFHSVLVIALLYLAARQGILGHTLKSMTVTQVKEEKKIEPEKPKPEIKEPERMVKTEVPKITQAPPPSVSTAVAPPAVAPAADQAAPFYFGGGKEVQTASSPIEVYKGILQSTLQSRWNRPDNIDDSNFVAFVEIDVDRSGNIKNPVFTKTTGNKVWDDSVRQAVNLTKSVNHAPPTNFPSHVTVKFDVTSMAEPVL